jgi:predicted TIM-barrel fold metal-dependent hydrolase
VDAAREIRKYAKEPGMVGVFLPCAGLERLWGHRQYDPIYEAAEEADLPVLLHSVTVSTPSSRSTPNSSRRSSDGTSAATPSR